MEEKWIFIKPYNNNEGIIPEGTELMFFRGQIYMNGGLIEPSYQQFLKKFIEDNNLSREYLKKVKLFKNKV